MHSPDARILRGAAIPTALAGVGAIAVALLPAGAKGALGAALATVVVLVFFSLTALALGFTAKLPPETAMLAGVTSYLVKIVVLMALVSAFRDATAWNTRAFGWTVIALALVWIFAEFRVTMQTRRPYIDDPVPAPRPRSKQGAKATAQADEEPEEAGDDRRTSADRSP